MKKTYLFVLCFIFVTCSPGKRTEPALDLAAYKLEIDSWHAKRVEELKGPKGWLNLAGLFWLNNGINTLGSAESSNIIFPSGKIPARAGFYLVMEPIVTFEAAPGVNIQSKGTTVKKMIAFHPDSAKAPILEYGSLQWFVIKRDNKYGIRLRDFENPAVQAFKGIDRYPVDAAWRIMATFEKADASRRIPVTNVLGQTTLQESPGTLIFSIQGKEYHLDALDEGGDEYFMIFGDATNARETYGAGRYLYVKRPDVDGKTIIDFNKGYNPPCAFTAFATCPLPPKQNVMDVDITAGEKNYEGRH
jgi:uncharacterized protein (DUF1684 family)